MPARRIVIYLILSMALFVSTQTTPIVQAEDTTPDNRGLSVSPPRQYIKVEAGQKIDSFITVYNYTDTKMVVQLDIEEFSVSDYAYRYQFTEPTEDIVFLSQTQITVEPGQNQKIPFSIAPPKNTTPGGQYYTVVSSADIKQNGIASKVQVATPLYIAIDGKQTYTSTLEAHSIRHFVTGDNIPFTLDIRNTGNVHYFAYVSSTIRGLFVNTSTPETPHLLLPNTVRRLESSVPSPTFPGVYLVTYGYKTDTSAGETFTTLVLYTPLWSYAVLAVLIWAVVRLVRRRKTH